MRIQVRSHFWNVLWNQRSFLEEVILPLVSPKAILSHFSLVKIPQAFLFQSSQTFSFSELESCVLSILNDVGILYNVRKHGIYIKTAMLNVAVLQSLNL